MNQQNSNAFLETSVSKTLIVVNGVLAAAYFLAILFLFNHGTEWLFWVLIAGEVFHVWQLFTFLYTIWDTEYEAPFDASYAPPVDVFITVAGEPTHIVEETVKAAKTMEYPTFRIFILNDGYVARKDNWQEMEDLAKRYKIGCITRTIAGGAKAGNINNGMRQTDSPLVVVFDADHVPHADFLQKTIGYFADPRMGFVQSPQYYKNHEENEVTRGSWEQQALFFGPICKGKNRLNATTMCGTNMVIRRRALAEVGGICEYSIAEDFITGMFIHQKGWKSCYVPEVLAEGLAPEDFLSYYKQQFRWARGSMDVLFRHNFLFKKGLSGAQKVQYLSSVSFFLSGIVVIMNALLPVLFFFTGMIAIQSSTMTLAAIFLPYIAITIFVLQSSCGFSYSFRSLAFSIACFNIHLSAIFAAIIGKKSAFSITSKTKLNGNFLNLVIPHIIYLILAVSGMTVAFLKGGIIPSVITNVAWACLNAAIFCQFIGTAMPERLKSTHEERVAIRQARKRITSPVHNN